MRTQVLKPETAYDVSQFFLKFGRLCWQFFPMALRVCINQSFREGKVNRLRVFKRSSSTWLGFQLGFSLHCQLCVSLTTLFLFVSSAITNHNLKERSGGRCQCPNEVGNFFGESVNHASEHRDGWGGGWEWGLGGLEGLMQDNLYEDDSVTGGWGGGYRLKHTVVLFLTLLCTRAMTSAWLLVQTFDSSS